MFSKAFGLAVLLVLCTQLPAAGISSAVSDTLKPKRYTLDAIRIIAEAPGQGIGRIHVKELASGKDSQTLNLKEAMLGISGISTTVGSKDESNLRIRGFRKNEIKILVDGRPLNPGYFGNVDLNSLSAAGFSEIRIIKGPASALYGTNTMGGVVNLITKEPNEQSWARILLRARRNNTNQIELSSQHRFDAWDYWISLSRNHTDGMVLPNSFEPTFMENGGVRNNAVQTGYGLQAKLNYRYLSSHTLGISFGATRIPTKEVPSSIYERKFRKYKNWQRDQASLMSEIYLAGNLKLSSVLSFDSAADTYQEYNDSQYQYLAVDSDMKTTSLGLGNRLQLDLSERSILDAGFRIEGIENQRKDNGDYLDWTSNKLMSVSAFLQHGYQLVPALKLHSSLGVSSFDLEGRKHPELILEPALALNYESPSSQSFSLSAGRNSAFPTMRQLFSAQKGNKDLQAQTAWKYEAGYHQPIKVGKLSSMLGIMLFYNDTTDLIDLKDGKYSNYQNVHTYGGEIEARFKPGSIWELGASYSYLDYEQIDGYILTESPRHSVQLTNNFFLPYHIDLILSSDYADIRTSQDSGYSFHTLAPYWVHDLQISRSWKHTRLVIGVENLFDTYYEGEYGYPERGLDFTLGMELEL
ncbi:MAG: TonB-dependent receptor [Candidatus Cloacimonetes bacterium]|nr:TonB-dependent receptor [Candidatus Cloacimonadota bacterium]